MNRDELRPGLVKAIVRDFAENRAGEVVYLAGVPRVGETIGDRMWSATVDKVIWYAQPYDYEVALHITREKSS